jgi:hypothetical protein
MIRTASTSIHAPSTPITTSHLIDHLGDHERQVPGSIIRDGSASFVDFSTVALDGGRIDSVRARIEEDAELIDHVPAWIGAEAALIVVDGR